MPIRAEDNTNELDNCFSATPSNDININVGSESFMLNTKFRKFNSKLLFLLRYCQKQELVYFEILYILIQSDFLNEQLLTTMQVF